MLACSCGNHNKQEFLQHAPVSLNPQCSCDEERLCSDGGSDDDEYEPSLEEDEDRP